MSWSIDKKFKTVTIAVEKISGDANLPSEIKSYIVRGLSGLPKQDGPVEVSGSGHVCEGPGSYEQTTCTLSVKPLVLVE